MPSLFTIPIHSNLEILIFPPNMLWYHYKRGATDERLAQLYVTEVTVTLHMGGHFCVLKIAFHVSKSVSNTEAGQAKA